MMETGGRQQGAPEGVQRLLRDLAALGALVDRRPSAKTRLERELGESTARGIVTSLSAALAQKSQQRAHG